MSTTTAAQAAEIAVITVNEGNIALISGTLTDEAGDAVPLAAIATLTLTLYDADLDSIINSRNAQSILNTNGGTLHATTGAFTLTLSAADNVIVTTREAGRTETHYGLVEATWTGGGYWSGLLRVRVRQVHRNA